MRDEMSILKDLKTTEKKLEELKEEYKQAKLGLDISKYYEFDADDVVAAYSDYGVYVSGYDKFNIFKARFLSQSRLMLPRRFESLLAKAAFQFSIARSIAYVKSRLEPDDLNLTGGWIVEFDTLHDVFGPWRNINVADCPLEARNFYIFFKDKSNARKAANFVNDLLGFKYVDEFIDGGDE